MKTIIPIALIFSSLLIAACTTTTTTTPKAINLQQHRIVVANVNLNNVAVAQKIANGYCTKYKKISVVTDSKKDRMIFKCVRA